MPNRILRDTALDSDRIAAVDEASEVLFYRLLMLADDFGRFDGRPAVIRARAFPLRQSVSEAQVIHRLQELCKVGLIYCYAVKGKPYLTIPRFGQRQRAEKSKFPAPPDNWQSDDGHLSVIGQTAAHVDVDVDVGDISPLSPLLEKGGIVDKSKTPKGNGRWWQSEQGTTAKAASLGLKAQPGESWPEFRERIKEAINGPRTGT